MLKLSDLNLRRCFECGKLFQSEPDKARCCRCADASPEEDSPPASVQSMPAAQAVSGNMAPPLYAYQERECLHCERSFAVEGSDFCLLCNVALFRALGDAANALVPRLGMPGKRKGLENAMVFRAILARRGRGAVNRFDLVATRRPR